MTDDNHKEILHQLGAEIVSLIESPLLLMMEAYAFLFTVMIYFLACIMSGCNNLIFNVFLVTCKMKSCTSWLHAYSEIQLLMDLCYVLLLLGR